MQSEWRVEATTQKRWDDDVIPVFYMVPREAENQSSLKGEAFWSEVERRLINKTRSLLLGPKPVHEYMRRARKNPNNCIALLVRYI